jgi:hypothetical protein
MLSRASHQCGDRSKPFGARIVISQPSFSREPTIDPANRLACCSGRVAQEQTPRIKVQIIVLLRDEEERWAKWLESQSDEFLAERVKFPARMTPSTKTRFEMPFCSKEHEMHHRGQLMLIERMLGIVPHLTRQMQERNGGASAVLAR